MGLYGLFADAERPGNFLVLMSLADEVSDFFLHMAQFLPMVLP